MLSHIIIVLFFILIVLNGLDVYTTKKVLNSGGYEKNPLMKKVLDIAGFKGLVVSKIVGLFIWGVVIFLLMDKALVIFLVLSIILNGLYGYIVYNNYNIIKKLDKKREYRNVYIQ